MEQNWKELWLKNYRGEGDTAELSSFLKKLNYGNRNGISYLPWATVERIFKLQDGKTETVLHKENNIVEADSILIREETDSNGVVSRVFSNSYFVNVRAEWNGQTHTERYPLQDGSGRPLSVWTQNEINKSLQRAKVKAIAIVSGIGFKLFEDGDLQFSDNEGNDELFETKKPAPAPAPKPKAEPKVSEKPTPIKLEVEVETKPIETPTESVETREEMENAIKRKFLSGTEAITTRIRAFLADNQVKKVSDLSQEALEQLYAEVI